MLHPITENQGIATHFSWVPAEFGTTKVNERMMLLDINVNFFSGDNFVHRLLQNKTDGKLVPSEGPPSESECAQEKIDSVQLEFTYLLTCQLEEQRMYFEDKLAQYVTTTQLSRHFFRCKASISTFSRHSFVFSI